MPLHPDGWSSTSKKSDTPKRPAKGPVPSDFDRPEPTEEVVGDEIVSDWSYDPVRTPPPQKRRTPPHNQTRTTRSPHSF